MVYIVGIGPGSPKYIIPLAVETIEKVDVIIGFERAAMSIPKINVEKIVVKTLKDIMNFITENIEKDIAIIASGDPCFYGITNYIKSNFKSKIEIVPGISSFQYLMCKLQKPWQNAYLGSMHGRREEFIKIVREHEISVWLTDKSNSPQALCRKLYENNIKATAYVGEELSYEDERIIKGTVEEIKEKTFNDLSVVVIENLN
ncbi:precorrin-6y C5,15-methyltransferase (decarboxylating) subunit CbiE [Clostridium sp. CF011]|uniref:precorrin-6y C5,15-methyltransferase (decarboxylating) subunit CbiE n=1 Tax=Clostridium TaxID=1485 RepID=UPI0013EE5AB9|nr:MULTISPECIES: precorrin-6y C5,15-methyltransferase (decarboxylating) subunit CbiE [Clostridium]MBU3092629.1 precorrin-6y C5,15-methyltransferase (decarboxylating) subunit CbiE [Clostridium sp. CF011]MBW9145329.1 precorrin-6y C5,15-methyltransferase (decarboxylating) subunit CbiE [Clostridium sp. CM027]MBZ9606927.1 precorrin-6y C5,15-methyltransferase (decarboxylating) subunit CbiE [Clostridium estertheticum]UVE42468.1 precorrin-6y C5,15-methyltransferase (decarboxylating) subunit CbiE [Clost